MLNGRNRTGSEDAGGAGAGEAPGETGCVSYVFALLFTEFTNDKSQLCDLSIN